MGKDVMKGLALVCCLAGVAAADDPPAPPETPAAETPPDQKSLTKLDTSKLEALFTQATKDYDVGNWDAAIAGFKQLYDLMPDPSFLFNLGQAYRQKGACREATAAYKSYLRHANDEHRPKVEAFVKELEPCVKIEEENARRLLPRPPPPPQGPTWPRTLRWAGYATGGLGVVLAGAGLIFTVRAHQAERDFERMCAGGCAASSELARLEQRGQDAERTATVFYVTSGVAVAAGAVLFAIGYRAGDRLDVQPTSGGAVVSSRWSW